MSEEVSILDNNFKKAILILSYAVIEINICSIFISLIAIKCRSKNIKKLRNKFFGLIFYKFNYCRFNYCLTFY